MKRNFPLLHPTVKVGWPIPACQKGSEAPLTVNTTDTFTITSLHPNVDSKVMSIFKCNVGGLTQLQISYAHVALQQVVHFLGGLFVKLILLAEKTGEYRSVSGNLVAFML